MPQAAWALRVLIWFLPFSVALTGDGIRVFGYSLWFLRFIQKLLK